jgi:membrane protein implicated in regulation of membrane protease activity
MARGLLFGAGFVDVTDAVSLFLWPYLLGVLSVGLVIVLGLIAERHVRGGEEPPDEEGQRKQRRADCLRKDASPEKQIRVARRSR